MLSRPRSDLKEKPEKDEKKAWKKGENPLPAPQ